MEAINFETDPSQYRHLELEIEGSIAKIWLNVKEDGVLRQGYVLKLNSYDLGVDIEIADAVQRLRFEHPEVEVVVISSRRDGIFSAGANIFMLASSTHHFKVNFCKFTNETRLAIEDATEHSGQTYIAALNGTASGGGYELPLACKEIYLVDDRRSAVSLPEVPYLAVLPGTGGLTRLVDKRKVRRDRADIFVTLAEGVKGQRAVDWGLVDGIFPLSRFNEAVMSRAQSLVSGRDLQGVKLDYLAPEEGAQEIRYKHVRLQIGPEPRLARIIIDGPPSNFTIAENPAEAGADFFVLRVFRELDDALLRLRFNYPEVGLVLLETRGELANVVRMDEQLVCRRDHWFIRETLLLMKRVLKRMEVSAKSFFALIDEGSCFAGSYLELALAADRAYMLDKDSVQVALTELNRGILPMGNGLSRLATKLLGEQELLHKVAASCAPFTAQEAEASGLVTVVVDELDWDDEIRIALEERTSMSPDALTGLEASLRFAGPETLETKIFGRLSAWQNWIFQRPNAVGQQGALVMYGKPGSPQFDWRRT